MDSSGSDDTLPTNEEIRALFDPELFNILTNSASHPGYSPSLVSDHSSSPSPSNSDFPPTPEDAPALPLSLGGSPALQTPFSWSTHGSPAPQVFVPLAPESIAPTAPEFIAPPTPEFIAPPTPEFIAPPTPEVFAPTPEFIAPPAPQVFIPPELQFIVPPAPQVTAPPYAQAFTGWPNYVPMPNWPPPLRGGPAPWIRYSSGARYTHEAAILARFPSTLGFRLGPIESAVHESDWYLPIETLWESQHPDKPIRNIASQFYGADLPSNTLLECERCQAVFDIKMRPVYSAKLDNIKVLPCIHCPNNRTGICREASTNVWLNNVMRLRREKEMVGSHFQTLFSTLPVGYLSLKIGGVFSGGNPQPVDDDTEIRMAYYQCRKLWIDNYFRLENGQPVGISLYLSSRIPELKSMRLWGDFKTDYILWARDIISAETFKYMYEVSPEHASDIAFGPGWVNQRQYLDDYVGYRRYMSKKHFHIAKRAAQRIAVAMEKYRTFKFAGMRGEVEATEVDAKQRIAFNRFEEMRNALCLLPDTLENRLSPAPLPRNVKKDAAPKNKN